MSNNQQGIKPIETHYRGYTFRSRLEARWAVFFDALGWRWEYEKEGFDLGDGLYYLPDFWLIDAGVFVEIKPYEPKDIEWKKAERLASRYPIIVVSGLPDAISYPMLSLDDDRHQISIYPIVFGWHKGEIGNFEYVWADIGTREDNWLGESYQDAIRAARSARFEHGENGAT